MNGLSQKAGRKRNATHFNILKVWESKHKACVMYFERTNCAGFLTAIELSLNWLSRVAKSLVNIFFLSVP